MAAAEVARARPPGSLPFPVHIPFVEELGLELWAMADGAAELRVDLARAHLNSWAVAHGGVLMTLLDVAMAHAARSSAGARPAAEPATAAAAVPATAATAATPATAATAATAADPPGVATVEMKTTFMRPAEGRLRALGRVQHRTATLAFTEGRVLDADGRLCAHATGTFKYLRALPSGRALRPLRGPGPADRAAPTPDTPETR
jgi:acyl-coenzyme A thioesterase PaaI-like protein